MTKLLALLFFSISLNAFAIDVTHFEKLAIQDGGRIKPFDTFARESLQLITGKATRSDKSPTEIVLAWLIFPSEWQKQRFIEVKNLKLKEDLGLKPIDNFASPDELMSNSKLGSATVELTQLTKQKKKLTPYFQAVQRVNNQLSLFSDIISGQAFKLVPQTLSPEWLSLPSLRGELHDAFSEMASGFLTAIAKHNEVPFQNAVDKFHALASSQAPSVYPQEKSLMWEITYNKTHPFRVAYVLYLISAIIFAFSLRKWALTFAGLGFTVHVVGFIFRCVIAGRPPVSNMYESIIWVSLGCVLFGLIFELIYKRNFIGLAATSVATIGLIIGDSVPAVLDQSIKPLEPVLRSNYWLTIHVLTITLSYAAFALAMGIGNIALSYYARGVENKNREKLNALALFVYRAVQVGVLLLTAGTILGGVWADYSWGRFWGWDPKETWALIADLGYLAVLHGRFSGWLKTFGTISAVVVAFSGVVMAWYGVNFVLGVGLHSYGFGGGGVHYVTAILIAQLLYVAFAGYRHRMSQRVAI